MEPQSPEFFCRPELLSELVPKIDAGRLRLVLRGPSGIGKSEVLRRLRNRMMKIQSANSVLVYHQIESSAHPVTSFLTSLTLPLVNNPRLQSFSISELREALNSLSVEYTIKLTTAVLLDLVKAGTPFLEKTAEAVIEVITESISESSMKALAERIVKTGQREILPGFFTLVNVLNKLGVNGTILIDRVEAGSADVQEVIDALISNLPEQWNLLLGINDETPAGADALHALRHSLNPVRGLEHVVPPLKVERFEEWAASVRTPGPNLEILEEVLGACQGRPLFLREWIVGMKNNPPEHSPAMNCNVYYQERLARISGDEAKGLVEILSLLPLYSYLDFSFIHDVLGSASPDKTLQVINELEQGLFLEQNPNNTNLYRFVHELTGDSIRNSLPSMVRVQFAARLCKVLEKKMIGEQIQQEYTRLILRHEANLFDLVKEDSLEVARGLLNMGDHRDSIRAYNVVIESGRVQKNDKLRLLGLLGLARAFFETGRYDEALMALDGIEIDHQETTQFSAEKNLLRGNLFVRRNEYEKARSNLQAARLQYNALGNFLGEAEARRRENVILRDLERYDEAVAHASRLVEDVVDYNGRCGDNTDAAMLTLCACYRSLIRSQAYQPECIVNATAIAEVALDLAVKCNSIRARGNCYLALGEAYRHAGQTSEAVSSYTKAIADAQMVANRDSLLWSTLGLSDTYVLSGKIHEADTTLNKVEYVLKGNSHKYPLEYAHWDFSNKTIKFLQGASSKAELKQLPALYEKLGITWPHTYTEEIELTTGAVFPKRF